MLSVIIFLLLGYLMSRACACVLCVPLCVLCGVCVRARSRSDRKRERERESYLACILSYADQITFKTQNRVNESKNQRAEYLIGEQTLRVTTKRKINGQFSCIEIGLCA